MIVLNCASNARNTLLQRHWNEFTEARSSTQAELPFTQTQGHRILLKLCIRMLPRSHVVCVMQESF